MTYQFSHFSKQITASLGEKDITVLISSKDSETVRHLSYKDIWKIHLLAQDVNHFRCRIFFNGDDYTLTLGSINMNLGLSRPSPEQLAAYSLFVKTLHQKVLADNLKQHIKFVCGNSAKMWFYIAIIVVFMTVALPIAISLKRYELLVVPFGSLAVLLFFMRSSGFTRPYYPDDNSAIARFLPNTTL